MGSLRLEVKSSCGPSSSTDRHDSWKDPNSRDLSRPSHPANKPCRGNFEPTSTLSVVDNCDHAVINQNAMSLDKDVNVNHIDN